MIAAAVQKWKEHARAIERALASIEAMRGPLVLERVAPGDVRAWVDHDLAALVENRLGLDVDPRTIGARERDAWASTATDDGCLYEPDAAYAQPYWLVWSGERVGTVAIGRITLGSTRASVTSLFVRRDRRRLGIAGAALDAIGAALRDQGLDGIRLETSWCWSDALAFYARRGLWVSGWKREIALVACPTLGPYRVEVDRDCARFFYRAGEREVLAIAAERRGDRLAWRELAPGDACEMARLAPGTFAVHLALRGWPLITCDAAWADQLRRGFSDFGGPEGLAFRVREWEAWSAHRGWRSTAPRIAGLASHAPRDLLAPRVDRGP